MINGGTTRDHDKKRDHIRDDAAGNDIQTAEIVMAAIDAFFDHGGLKIKLHPRRNGRADEADDRCEIGRIGAECWYDGLLQRQIPIRLRQECRYGIGKIDERSNDEDALHRLVAPAYDDHPYEHGTDGHDDVLADSENSHTGREAGKLRDNVTEIREPEHQHGEERGAQSEFFANQIG